MSSDYVSQQAAAEAGVGTETGKEAELQREVEDLKLRLHMAAEHYKEKYKECQKLQRQVAKLSEQQGVSLSKCLQTAVGYLECAPGLDR